MQKIKQFLTETLVAIVSVICIIVVVLMIFALIAWTIGLLYVAANAGCSIEDGRLLCELASEVGTK